MGTKSDRAKFVDYLSTYIAEEIERHGCPETFRVWIEQGIEAFESIENLNVCLFPEFNYGRPHMKLTEQQCIDWDKKFKSFVENERKEFETRKLGEE